MQVERKTPPLHICDVTVKQNLDSPNRKSPPPLASLSADAESNTSISPDARLQGNVVSCLDEGMRFMRSEERKEGRGETKSWSGGGDEDRAHHTQLQERLQLIIYIICHCALHWTTQQTAAKTHTHATAARTHAGSQEKCKHASCCINTHMHMKLWSHASGDREPSTYRYAMRPIFE